MRNLGHALLVGIALAAPILQAMAQSDTAVGDEVASAPAGTVASCMPSMLRHLRATTQKRCELCGNGRART